MYSVDCIITQNANKRKRFNINFTIYFIKISIPVKLIFRAEYVNIKSLEKIGFCKEAKTIYE